MSPTLDYRLTSLSRIPLLEDANYEKIEVVKELIDIFKKDWDLFERSWGMKSHPFLLNRTNLIQDIYTSHLNYCNSVVERTIYLERENNKYFIEKYNLHNSISSSVDLKDISLTLNPYSRYSNSDDISLKLRSDTFAEFISYTIGCQMGRYSLDREGLVYAHEGNKGFADLVAEGAYKTFPADSDGILPLMDDEWFEDDVTSRVKEFVRTVWGEEHLQENLEFIAESLCLYAIKPKKGESALETIRRYLSTQFWKDHLKMYKKRPIYWLFSSGKEKAFECLVYLHRYNDATLSRMRTEYVVPLLARYQANIDRLNDQLDEASGGEATRLKRERDSLIKKFSELRSYDDRLRHYADMRISIDLDDGVKVNYGKFGDLLADVKAITGNAPEVI